MTIAKVNDIEISRETLDTHLANLANNPNIPTPEKTDEKYGEFEKAVAEQLVNDELIYKKATDEGHAPSAEDIEKEYDQIKAKFESEEALKTQLAQMNLTPETLKETIARQKTIDGYYDSLFKANNISATDEEAQKLYDEYIKGKDQAPEFDAIKDQIKMEISQQKMHMVLSKEIQELRKDAKIEILL